MAARRMTPGRDPPTVATRPVVLHASDRTRISRIMLPTGPVIRKEPLGPDAQQRLGHEVEILERLSGVEGVVQLAAGPAECTGSILLADVDGTALSRRDTPLEPAELIALAESLAHAVAGMHHRGVMHRDICPANIVVAAGNGAPCLIDFALATTCPVVRPEPGFPGATVGTLPYLAPELIGRTGRPVDQRTDLYALGATLYELATGAPPFGTGNPFRIIHDHLARIPTRPGAVNPSVPAGLSVIIMHLLEKEPDDRYQSADGLAHDLALVRRGAPAVHPGEHDLPMRPLAPSRLVGRDREVDELDTAFARAVTGGSHGVLVTGAPGVGKTSLVNALRPIVAGDNGWFVAGKFDQYRRGQDYDGVRQGLRALGRLLLAESEDYLAEVRERMLRALGSNAGLITATVPELAALLRVPPEPGEPMTAQVRLSHAPVEVLRAVVSSTRPVVFFIDDLQWAGRTPLGFIDLVFSGEERIAGLLLVAAYRERDIDAAHPLAPLLARWCDQRPGPQRLRLRGLSPTDQTSMVADMLHLAPEPAARLARAIAPSTGGNPYDIVELLNSLRRDGVVAPGAGGWRWDAAVLRRRLDRVEVTALLAARVAALPPDTAELLAAMACLGGQVELRVLAAATGLPVEEVERLLTPALGEGLLVRECDAHPSVRFHHDRTRDSVLGGCPAQEQAARRLRLARRLAARPELFAAAAEQYLPVVDAVRGTEERRAVAALFRRAAEQAKLLSNYPLVERFLAAAVELVDPADTDSLIAVLTERQAALYSLGRLEDTDDTYRTISRLCTRPAQLTSATVVQVISLTNRGLASEATQLGLGQLRRLGVSVPGEGAVSAETDRGLDELPRWLDTTSEADDLRKPGVTDQDELAVIRLVNRLMVATFFCDQTLMAWLSIKMLEIWARHGPDRTLVGPVSHLSVVCIVRRGDYRTGHRILQRILAVGRARGYEPEIWQAQFIYVITSGHWFTQLEDILPQGRQALEGLVHGGDLQNACWVHYALLCALLDSAPSLDVVASAVDEALAFAARTGNRHAEGTFREYQRLVQALRGEATESAGDEAAELSLLAGDPFSVANLHAARALVATILDRPADAAHHAAAVVPCRFAIETNYSAAVARVLLAIALAAQVRAAGTEQRDTPLRELDTSIEWLAARAADAPANFLPLLRLAEAERAWAVGNFHEAAYTFDVALREVSVRTRPWHRALVLERAARFYLAHAMEEAGYALLATARRQYLEWGATAKVSQLDWAYPGLRNSIMAGITPATQEPIVASPAERPGRRSAVAIGTVDLLAVVAASQALSSETSVAGLQTKVAGILSEMTGATSVHLLLYEQEQDEWLVPTDSGDTVTLREAGRRRVLPSSVVRYAARTHAPVVVPNAARDDRFNRDAYFAGLERCSLLAIPITIRRALRAMLLLENRMIRGAFSTERLEGIMLIAGQLAVSLDNARVYASMERKVADRTKELAATNKQLAAVNRQLEQLSVTDPLTGLANRRRLGEVLKAEWQRARQHATPIALAMIDIDHFKLYNDHFGHAAGDRCLQRVAACLAKNVGGALLTARYGGEEFTVVMPDTDLGTATRLGRRLCRAVEDLAEPHPLTAESVITVSIGVTAATPAEDDGEAAGDGVAALTNAADAALYRAKNGGRNQVETA
ncbi:diguanylate cyclase [Parafrankia sp. EUN1f]|uniref:diguanylate cyclase n=1 Tax=Parafrankia sp. EUN1f TaxID=102897 RepID=UPI0001C4472D|nr:diguanylate cyclase [Parafrankia sp. EUN1f]EFC83384.1 serine/threonine protein kinase [Parafrankia sp. EUN1f]